MRIFLFIFLFTNVLNAGRNVNRYFDALIEYGIDRKVTLCQRITSKLLKEVRGHNWAGLIQNIDTILDKDEKDLIKARFRRLMNKYPRLARKTNFKAPSISSDIHDKYRWVYRIMLTFITKCDLDEFWELLVFLDRLLHQMSKRRDFDRRSRIFFIKLQRALDEMYD
jgi:hypothetical protein